MVKGEEKIFSMTGKMMLLILISLLLFTSCDAFKLPDNEQKEQVNGAEPTEMVFIPAGEFTMGSNYSPNPDVQDGVIDEGFSSEHPKRTVYLSAYLIDITEVTNAQYRACVLQNACEEPMITSSLTRDDYYTNPAFDNYPVVNVTWFQAQQYCHWVGKRLPTEAEWEKAARGATDERTYPWGNEKPNCLLANFGEITELEDGSTQIGCLGDTEAVGSYPLGASEYGVLDMAGNVSEWVSDWYNPEYYNSNIFPDNSINPQGPPTGSLKVVRGGSFSDHPYFIRVTMRLKQQPSLGMPHIGFRCAKSAE